MMNVCDFHPEIWRSAALSAHECTDLEGQLGRLLFLLPLLPGTRYGNTTVGKRASISFMFRRR